ncbi:hypothetical protein [Labrys wisconsinensis]|uniref:Uncharacterized protein n=1 Tax=Labrys wisconsinensis TaxID=425677 RepID=A0ABU0J3T5_9HYPH|nr:hypothetical protein [Labrys wisconsinensis]MDQ0468927.1 hypothetical protein [Labrys wisconsinensis]
MRRFTLGLMIVIGSVPAVHAAEFLTPDQIKTTFVTGVPFTAETLAGKARTITLKADGSAEVVSKGQKKGETGKWRLSTDGYCSTWGKGTENCFLIKKVGKKYAVMTAKKEVVAHWSK